MAAIPLYVKEFRESGSRFFLTHCCSSAANGVTWGDTIEALQSYWAKDPFDNAIAAPCLSAHPTDRAYKRAFRYKSELPTNALYYFTRIVGTKKVKQDVAELKAYVAQCKQIGIQFAYFMNNEWIFDNPSAGKL